MHESMKFKWLAEARDFLKSNGFRYIRIGSRAKYQEHWAKGALRATIHKAKPGRPRIVEFN